jgi:hypothetical protein
MAMKYDLWDVAAAKNLGRFETETEALGVVRTLLAANGDAYAKDLVLGSTEDGRGAHNLTGAALIERAVHSVHLDAADEPQLAFYGSFLAEPVKTAAGSNEPALKYAPTKPWSPSKAAGARAPRSARPETPSPIHGQQRDSIGNRKRTQKPKKG